MDEVLHQIDVQIQILDDMVRGVGNGINALVSMMPEVLQSLLDAITGGWDKLCKQMDSVWTEISDRLLAPGDPMLLDALSKRWANEVGSPISARIGDLTDSKRALLDSWVGTAAKEYAQKVGDQKTVLDSIQETVVTAITGALDALSGAITTFWWVFAGCVAGYVAAALTLAAACATVAGIPLGIAIFVAAVATILITMGAAYSALSSAAEGATSAISGATSAAAGPWPAFAVA